MIFEEWLNAELGHAEDEVKESHKAAMNSYGAGYDAGYVAALKLVFDKMSPELAATEIDE